ncbi:hypothetical protein E8A74_05545 [Polyangium fumosum]|uniref:Uncharacterized protein n=1 Tax=Polyangium fumosum TaxID=889272 RepID=A0A4U1JHJ2_9BACT|nr:hypothetical protein E8A74_05545 [Polyangium fumosum]
MRIALDPAGGDEVPRVPRLGELAQARGQPRAARRARARAPRGGARRLRHARRRRGRPRLARPPRRPARARLGAATCAPRLGRGAPGALCERRVLGFGLGRSGRGHASSVARGARRICRGLHDSPRRPARRRRLCGRRGDVLRPL